MCWVALVVACCFQPSSLRCPATRNPYKFKFIAAQAVHKTTMMMLHHNALRRRQMRVWLGPTGPISFQASSREKQRFCAYRGFRPQVAGRSSASRQATVAPVASTHTHTHQTTERVSHHQSSSVIISHHQSSSVGSSHMPQAIIAPALQQSILPLFVLRANHSQICATNSTMSESEVIS
jgi:hypothetical protein